MSEPARTRSDAQQVGRNIEDIRRLKMRGHYEVSDWYDLSGLVGTGWSSSFLEVRSEGGRAWLMGNVDWIPATGIASILLDTGEVPTEFRPDPSTKIFPAVDHQNYSELGTLATDTTMACSMVATGAGQIGSAVFTQLDGTVTANARQGLSLTFDGISWPLVAATGLP